MSLLLFFISYYCWHLGTCTTSSLLGGWRVVLGIQPCRWLKGHRRSLCRAVLPKVPASNVTARLRDVLWFFCQKLIR